MVSRASVRRLRRALGLPAKRQRRARQARRRREPAAQMGALVQVDGSEFAWFEDRGPVLTLHGAIDDATGCDPGPAAPAPRGSAWLCGPAARAHYNLRRPAGPVRRRPQRLRAQRSALDPRRAAAGRPGPDPLRPHPPRSRHRLHHRALGASQGPHRTPLADPAGSPRERAAPARHHRASRPPRRSCPSSAPTTTAASRGCPPISPPCGAPPHGIWPPS